MSPSGAMPDDRHDLKTVPVDLVVVIPCFGDWGGIPRLLVELDTATRDLGKTCHVIVVNDGGPEPPGELVVSDASTAGTHVEVVALSRNLGHQRAIAIGLAYAADHHSAEHLLVMDADGEDSPASLARLYAEAEKAPGEIVFASRTRRSEGPAFRIGYLLYKALFRLMTGRTIDFGNFSLVPWPLLSRLAVSPEIWVHFAAGAMRARLPYRTLPVPRQARYDGESKMGLVGLVLHGMAAISLFSDVAAVRILAFALMVLVAGGVAIGTATALKLFTALATPGWATNVVAAAAILMTQAATLSLVLVFVGFQQRAASAGVMPCEIYAKFIASTRRIRCIATAAAD